MPEGSLLTILAAMTFNQRQKKKNNNKNSKNK
jgi:hypothetical protein